MMLEVACTVACQTDDVNPVVCEVPTDVWQLEKKRVGSVRL